MASYQGIDYHVTEHYVLVLFKMKKKKKKKTSSQHQNFLT